MIFYDNLFKQIESPLIPVTLELARDKVQTHFDYVLNQFGKDSLSLQPTGSHTTMLSDSVSNLVPKQHRSVIGGIFSPVSNLYGKKNLVSSSDRIELVQIACESTSDWLAVDDWEASQSEWTRTRSVLDHFQQKIASVYKKLNCSVESETRVSESTESNNSQSHKISQNGMVTFEWLKDKMKCKYDHKFSMPLIKLVCGADLLESFATPTLWDDDDIETIVRDYGIVCMNRPGSDILKAIYHSDILSKYEANILIVTDWCQCALSSTIVRRALSRGESVRYLIPSKTLEEIYARGLYGAKLRSSILNIEIK